MILSHKYRFIFIKTAKTAGTSIEVYLSRFCGEEDVLTPIRPPVEPHRARNHRGLWDPRPEIGAGAGRGVVSTLKDLVRGRKYYNHIPARVAKQRTPRRIWETYFKFCVERNPWDKTMSHYSMLNERAGGSLSLDEYLARGRFCWNLPKYTDADGKVMVDRVLAYESLMDGLADVFRELGVPFDGSLGVRAKDGRRTRSYREDFSDMQRRIVETAFADEIAMHGYVF